jgi:hypothetical protein
VGDPLRTTSPVIDVLGVLRPRAPFDCIFHALPQGAVWIAGPRAMLAPVSDPAIGQALLQALDADRAAAAPSTLGLDFALAGISTVRRKLYLARGAIGRPTLYANPTGAGLRFSTTLLPFLRERPIDTAYVPEFLATAQLSAPSDINHTCATPLRGWLRAPRAGVLAIDLEDRTMTRRDAPLPPDASPFGQDPQERLRDAVDAHLAATVQTEPFACELSGGIDSGIVAARTKRLAGDRMRACIGLHPPFPELRWERSFMEAMAAHAGLPLHLIEPDDALPFARLREAPAHDEPNLTALAWALLDRKLGAARRQGARVLLHGVGGDQVFMQRRGEPRLRIRSPRRPIVTSRLRRDFAAALGRVEDEINGPAGDRFVALGTFLYDGWADRYLGPPAGVRYEPGLLSLPIVQAARALHAVLPNPEGFPKHVPRAVFARDLPTVVRERRGKVPFDGVYQRGLRRHIDDALGLVEEHAGDLECARLRPRAIAKELFRAASIGWEPDTTPAMAALAWCVWRHAIERHDSAGTVLG